MPTRVVTVCITTSQDFQTMRVPEQEISNFNFYPSVRHKVVTKKKKKNMVIEYRKN